MKHFKILFLAAALTCAMPVLADCILRQSDAVELALGPYVDSTDGVTAETGLTISQGDVILKKCTAGGDCAASAQKNDAGACAHDANGMYECDLDATDTNTVGILEIWSFESGAAPVFKTCQIVEEAVFDRDYLAAGTGIVGTAQTGDNFARLGAPAGASVSADILALDVESDLLIEALVGLGAEQTADSGTTTTAVDAALTQATNDWFLGMGIYFTSGTLLGQNACVTGFTAASDTLTFAPAVTTAVTTHTYYLIPSSGCQAFVRVGAAGASLSAIPWNAAWDAEVESEVDDSIGGGTGTSLTAIPWAAAWDAEVQSEANDALVANFLDYLFNADYNPASKPGNAGGIINELVENDGGATRFTSEALELAPTSGGGNMTQIEGVDATDAIDARIAAANILRPTTASRTLDVTASGNAGIDLDNVTLTNAAPTQGIGASGTLSGTHSVTTADLGTNAPAASVDVVGRTLDVFTSSSAPKFSVTVTAYDSSTGIATFTTVTTAGVNGDLWYLWDTALGSGATDVNLVTVEGSAAKTYLETLDNPLIALVGTPVDLGVGGANIADNLQEIESQTDDIGAAGAGLTASGITAAGVRTAVGLASANLDTQLTAIDDFVDTEVATAVSQTTAATIRGDVGLASANLDTQLDALPTNAELATSQGTADDATLSAIAALPTAANNRDTLLTAERVLTGTCDSGSTTTCVDDALTQAATSQIDDHLICFDDSWCGLVTDFTTGTDTVTTTKVAPSTRSAKAYTIYPATAN